MQNNKIFLGSDFSLQGELVFEDGDTALSLDQFDIQIGISTTPLGHKVIFSDTAAGALPILRKTGNRFVVSVPADESAKLSAGIIVITAVVTHRQTGVRSVAEQRSVELAEPRNTFDI